MRGESTRKGNVWINNTVIERNERDGLNVTFAGGNVLVNGTSLSHNGMRGAAFHHNDSVPFLALEQGIRFLGRSGSMRFFLPSQVNSNAWGGVLVGNFCASAVLPLPRPFVALDFVQLTQNRYHPAVELHACQRPGQPRTLASVTGCFIEQSGGFGIRVAPLVNMELTIAQNALYNNSRALLVRNREHPQLRLLPAKLTVYKNQFKFNRGPYAVSVGLNEDAPSQSGAFHQQNELRENVVTNPYAHLNPRSTPYAALVVSSSNVRVEGNCFRNPDARYELATDLTEHAKTIDASRNNWGAPELRDFAYKIFDQFYRYNLARVEFVPFASTCNAQNPNIVEGQTSFVRQFRQGNSGELGGMIYGNADLTAGTYTVTQDLHILPGARVSIAPGAELQFANGIGMLVQGELNRLEFRSFGRERVTFTSLKRNLPVGDGIRLVHNGNANTMEGRLEVKIDEQWGTVCNRSWTVELAAKACHQLGLIIDPEFLENWLTYPPPGKAPMLMDNVWCEEAEWDLRQCRHDGRRHNIAASCPPTAVVGLRCVEAHWAGVRYSLLANPPLVTGQRHMEYWTIERAGLLDFALPEFSAALQLDWNYHNFEDLVLRDNFWNGLDIVYNDLTRKPTIFSSEFSRNRRHGIRLRSVGLTVQNSKIRDNVNAGIRYNPIIPARLQKDVVTWLLAKDMRLMEGNHVYVMPRRELRQMTLGQSAESSRRFLVARPTAECPDVPTRRCVWTLPVNTDERSGHLAVQVVNRASNESDEDVVISAGGREWRLSEDLIRFPLLVNQTELTLRYTRSYGPPQVVLLLLYMGREEYVDRFVHVYLSEVSGNAYGVSTLHYSNFSHWDGATINRWESEKLVHRDLVHRDPWALQHLYTERVSGILLYSLPFVPPSVDYGYERLRSLSRYVCRLISNDWRWDAPLGELRERLGLPELLEQGLRLALAFLFDSVLERRRYHHYLAFHQPRALGMRLRGAAEEETGRRLVVNPRLGVTISKLQPVRLARAWNALPLASLFPPGELHIGRGCFRRTLGELVRGLPAETRVLYGLPPAPPLLDHQNGECDAMCRCRFQKTTFARNKQAVVWVNGPLRDVGPESTVADITYHVDNCSVTENSGAVIETHRDLHSSANVFHWIIWSSTFRGNKNGGVSVALPDTFDLRSPKDHSFWCTESRFYNNRDFQFDVRGFYAVMNISSNNFTENHASEGRGLIHIRGMEKEMVMERNRWTLNHGSWVVKYDTQSQTLKRSLVPAVIRFNYFDQNWFLASLADSATLINYPRSYAVGFFGLQRVNLTFNRLNNFLMDYECVVGLRPAHYLDTNDFSLNWWGEGGSTPLGLLERVYDFDDRNSYMLAKLSPYYVTEEQFLQWWWLESMGQRDSIQYLEPSIYSLRGRMYESKTLTRTEQRWPTAPFYRKPQRPYLLSHDLTVMPGATLTIDKGVSLHLMPNVRILVLGSLRAEGSFYDPIRIRPLNKTEMAGLVGEAPPPIEERTLKLRQKRDVIAAKFPLLARQDGFYQKLSVFLKDANRSDAGFLEIYNATTGEMVPICDRQFTRRNAQVVCRELGLPSGNVYSWVGPRWSFDPRVRITRQYSEPRQCFGHEKALAQCDLRLTGERSLWWCSDSLHFVFVHCAGDENLEESFVGHHGGIVFSAPSLEASQATTSPVEAPGKESVLRHVEIFGGGLAHNESIGGAALSLIYRAPTLEFVNVTNSSRDGLLILAPRAKVELKTLNVSHNNGLGLNLVALNLQSTVGGSGQGSAAASLPDASQERNLSLPYNVFGMLDLCAAAKNVTVENRILVYYKYDSYPVDCLKVFRSAQPARKIGFRLLQVNIYPDEDSAGRPDGLHFYSDAALSPGAFLGTFNASVRREAGELTYRSPNGVLGLHLRANAATGDYGLVAEVASLPASPDQAPVRTVSVESSRFVGNERGAALVSSAGETSPDVLIDNCYFGRNGRQIWGNLSTSTAALRLQLHNTRQLRVAASVFWRNVGGLVVEAGSSSAGSRLSGLVKDTAFAQNVLWETMALKGVEYQAVSVLHCVFAKNRARYRDIVLLDRVIANFSRNTFLNNTGTHIVDMTGYPGLQTEYETFTHNWLYDNIALGHGYQFSQRYGYLPPDQAPQQRYRKKRQVTVGSDGTSFDWWAHVGSETERYRSTILAGSARQHYQANLFANPLNDFELTTVNKTELDGARDAVDATGNFWGAPGTEGVAAGKIRDEADYDYLLPVRFRPVLPSNVSLLQGSCAPGWLQAGDREFRSCYLLVPGVMDYHSAVSFCQDQGAVLPYFSPSDPRLRDIVDKVAALSAELTSPVEGQAAFPPQRLRKLWYSGVEMRTGRCGSVDLVSGSVEEHNCGELLAFVCGAGTARRPFLWTAAGWAVVGAVAVLLCLLAALLAGWWHKSRERKKEHFQRKASLRESIRSNKMAHEYAKRRAEQRQAADTSVDGRPGPGRPRSPVDLITAHKAMVAGKTPEPSPTKHHLLNSSMSSLGTSLTQASPTKPKQPLYSTGTRDPSDYGSYYGSVPNFDSGSSSRTPQVRPDRQASDTATLSSFRGTEVRYRDGKASSSHRRHDTNLTEATATTATCSTCPTDSSVSYEPSGATDSRYSRTTAYSDDGTFSDTESRTTLTATVDGTIDEERSDVFARTPGPGPHDASHREPYAAYLQPGLSPADAWERNAGGASASPSKGKSPYDSSSRPRPGLPPPPRPAYGPPPPGAHQGPGPSSSQGHYGTSFPNLAFVPEAEPPPPYQPVPASRSTEALSGGGRPPYMNWGPPPRTQPPPIPARRADRKASSASSDEPLETAM